jgi:predicted aspartyl protease
MNSCDFQVGWLGYWPYCLLISKRIDNQRQRISVTGLTTRKTLAAILAGALLTGVALAEVPLSWDSTGHVVVPAMVNGKGPFQFILDTGADESAVYSWFAKSLNLPKGASGELSGATGSAQMMFTRLSTLSLDGHAIRDINADTIPDRPDGAKLGGVAGVDLMMHRLAVIDFGCGTIALLPTQEPRSEIVGRSATLIRAGSIRDGKQLTLPVSINNVTGIAVLDSGSRNTIINHKFAEAAGINPLSSVFRDGPHTRGATGTAIASRVGPIGTVHFAGITRRNAVARVADMPFLEGAGLANTPAMTLGLDFLRGTRLTIDYSARRFWFAKSVCKSPGD